jgi:predicted metal-dependent phosphoesterase TrpH
VHDAGGIASIAHPGSQARDEWLQRLVDAGLDAVEAYHSEHDAATTARYVEFAKRAGIAVTGGSDYHGDPAHGGRMPGSVSLPREAFEALRNLVI